MGLNNIGGFMKVEIFEDYDYDTLQKNINDWFKEVDVDIKYILQSSTSPADSWTIISVFYEEFTPIHTHGLVRND